MPKVTDSRACAVNRTLKEAFVGRREWKLAIGDVLSSILRCVS